MLPTWMPIAASAIMIVVQAAAAEEPQDLFNGRDLAGWVAEGVAQYTAADGQVKPVWSVQDGLLLCAGKGYGFLRYDRRTFADFILHVEYRMAPRCNSGIGIRTVPYVPGKGEEKTRPSLAAYEIQLLDDAGQKPTEHSSGSLYRYLAPRVNAVKAAPEWNAVTVECRGPLIRIVINDQEVINVDQRSRDEIKDKPLRGYVCLQNHGGRIEFRKVHIQDRAVPADSK